MKQKQNMKKFKILTLAGVMFILAGCFAEDYSFCPPDPDGPETNVVLNFRLPAPEEGCSFLNDVSSVTTAIYNDETGALVQTVNTTSTHHQAFKGLKLSLPAGTYRVVSWGNHGTNTVMNGHEKAHMNGTNAHIAYNSINGGVVGDGDALYYAPAGSGTTRATTNGADEYYTMEVDADNGHESTLEFRHAHRRIDVYVKGFSSSGSTTPVVELSGLPSAIGFLGMDNHEGQGLVSSRITSQPVTINEDGKPVEYRLSSFHIFYLRTGDYDIGVNVIDPVTDEKIYSTKLNDHIDPEEDDPSIEMALSLLVEFKGVEVMVTIPEWNSEDVGYGWWD